MPLPLPVLPPPPAEPPAEKGGPGSGGVVPAGEHMMWGGGFHSERVPGADRRRRGRGFRVGTYRVLADREQTLWVGGFDGKSLQRRWAAGLLRHAERGASSTHVAVAGMGACS